MARRLASIRRDRRGGARSIAERTLEALQRSYGLFEGLPVEAQRREIRRLAARLRGLQPAMGTLARWADELERLSSRSTMAPARGLRRFLSIERRRLSREFPRVLRFARTRLLREHRYVTISRGETVLESLRTARPAHRPKEVVVLRSLPGGEGAVLARELARASIRARLVDDRDGVSELRRSDAVLIGADTIYRDGSVVHKVGTRRLARGAARRGIPVYVLTGLSKLVDRLPSRGTRLPPLFDLTPARWLSEFWTDKGALRPADVARAALGRPPGARRRIGRRTRRPGSEGRPAPRTGGAYED